MGTDIYSLAEYKENGQWKRVGEIFFDRWYEKTSSPFNARNYALFSWLAAVRIWCDVKPLSQPRGFPPDFDNSKPDDVFLGSYSYSYFYLSELLAVDYNVTFLDELVGVDISKFETITLKQHLGRNYFETLEVLKTLGKPENVRVIFGFE